MVVKLPSGKILGFWSLSGRFCPVKMTCVEAALGINGRGRAPKHVLDRLTGQVVKSGAIVLKSRCHFIILVYYIHLHMFSSFLISR